MSGWPIHTIRDIAVGVYDGPHATPPTADEGPVFLGIGNVTEDGHLDLTSVRHIAEADFGKWTKRVTPAPGDIVFTYEATLNRYAIIPDGFRGCLGRRMALIRPNADCMDTRFLFYSLFGQEWRSTIEANRLSGATVDRIPIKKFPDFPIRVPPLETQRRIASILGAYDDLIDVNRRRVAVLEEMARGLFEEWFVRFRFPGHENVPILDTPDGPLPEGWEFRAIDDAFEILGGGTPSKKVDEYWDGGTIDWYTPSDLTGSGSLFMDRSSLRITERGLTKSSAKLFPSDSIMMTSRATLGVIAICTGQASTNQGFITCLPNDGMPRSYLYYWLRQNVPLFIAHATGATFKEITKGVFKRLRACVPGRAVTARFEVHVRPMHDMILSIERSNRKLAASRDLLLPRLISGQLSVEAAERELEDAA